MASSILWFVIAILSAAGEVGQLNVPAPAANHVLESFSVQSDLSMNATWADDVVVLPSESQDFRLHLSGYHSIDGMWQKYISGKTDQQPEKPSR